MVQEHKDLIASIRSGQPLNEGQRVAESTLTAIGARIAAYTGKVITWDWLMNTSKQEPRAEGHQARRRPVPPHRHRPR